MIVLLIKMLLLVIILPMGRSGGAYDGSRGGTGTGSMDRDAYSSRRCRGLLRGGLRNVLREVSNINRMSIVVALSSSNAEVISGSAGRASRDVRGAAIVCSSRSTDMPCIADASGPAISKILIMTRNKKDPRMGGSVSGTISTLFSIPVRGVGVTGVVSERRWG